MTVLTLEQFGGGTSVPDNSGAWAKMMGAIGTNDASIEFGVGTYTFLSTVAANLTGSQHIGIFGESRRLSSLLFPQSSGLIVALSSDPWCSFCLSDFEILTTQVDANVGLSLVRNAPITSGNPALSATNDITRVSIGGGGTGMFSIGLLVDGPSNVNYDSLEIFGTGWTAGSGPQNPVGIQIQGSATASVVHNFTKLNASFMAVGMKLGGDCQGVTVCAGSNFTGVATGVWIPSDANNVFQLTVSDSQFEIGMFSILDQTPLGVTLFASNNLILQGNGATGIPISVAANLINNKVVPI